MTSFNDSTTPQERGGLPQVAQLVTLTRHFYGSSLIVHRLHTIANENFLPFAFEEQKTKI